PGMMMRTFVPRLAISRCTEAVAPCPRLTMPTTAPTPMTMPSMVRPARRGFRRRMRRAERIVNQRKLMREASPHLRPKLKTRRQFFLGGVFGRRKAHNGGLAFVDLAGRD